LDEYEHTNAKIYKPNIIFKVKAGINLNANDQNYYLFQKALRVTTIKMIPTYVLCDSKPNKDVIPQDFAIMGCRTRVVADKYGKTGSMERGNIAYVTINLPRIALEISKKLPDKLSVFLSNWGKIAETTSKILEHRYYQLVLKRQRTDFRTNSEYDLWCESFRNNSLGDIFKHGTLAIGFIGLSEAVEILTGKKYYEDVNACKVAVEIATYMRNYIDHLRDTSKFNYSLLATSGEFISGKFLTIDKSKGYSHRTMSKGYYTNSFHIDVSAGISAFEKIAFEAPFHELCNGGCITYIELKEAPLNNELALEEIINFSISQGIHYLGFNYNLDICNDCDTKGVFDACPECGCSNITRIRRVSGYLEILDYFTEGKKHEEKHRKLNKIKK
jgi:ribonucleoside-triphosphate reductase